MKLWYSFTKELKLASRGYYFYIEIFMAALLLMILLFAVPEEFNSKSKEYISMDLPEKMLSALREDILEEDIDGQSEFVEMKNQGEVISVEYFESDDTKMYLFENKEAMIYMTEEDRPSVGAHMSLDESGNMNYEYYMQGYESEKLRNVFLIFHNRDLNELTAINDKQEVRSLGSNYEPLTDRENVIPSVLTFNGSLMGLFIVAAYIFLDKQEGIIKAYAITASSVWHYLMSKTGVILVTSIISSIIIVVPIMGQQVNYPLLLLLLITSGFFVSSLGLVIASFYKNLMQAFGIIYAVMIVLLLPNIAYFIPSWEPVWIKLIPTHPLIQGFKETIMVNGDTTYTLLASLGFLVVGVILFIIANIRYKKTLAA
ncbi:MAG: ABC transporter permease [Eubacteriaceae bacterium]